MKKKELVHHLGIQKKTVEEQTWYTEGRNRGNLNHKPGGSKHRRKAAKRHVQREPIMEAGVVVVLRQVPLEWL